MSSAVISQTVSPNRSPWETVLLCATGVGLILFTTLYTATFGRQETVQSLQDWQVSAYSGLSGVDQALYSQLQLAAEDIEYMHQISNRWPEDLDFQEAFLAPFYRDMSWERNGSLQWSSESTAGEDGAGLTFYHGHQGSIASQGAWLLRIDHSHAGATQVNNTTIWWNADGSAPAPEVSQQQSLILNGWRQVVPYQGRDEVERLNAG